MVFSLCMHGKIPTDEILGVVVGHVWYFFADVWPGLYDQRPMDPPEWWVRLFEGRREDTGAQEINANFAAAARGPQEVR